MNYPEKSFFERSIRGLFHGTAKGSALYKFINSLKTDGILLKEQRMKGDTLHFTAKRGDRKYIEHKAEELSIELVLEEEPSLASWLFRYRKRFGIPIGIVLGAVLLIYCSNVVMVIDIEGNNAVSDMEILSALEECSVRKGTFVGDIDFYRTELHIRSCFDEIAWAGMRHTGNRLVVEVMELNQKPEMLNDRVPCHIVADKTAQITHTSVSAGQLVKKEGEAVKKGEVIVNGIWADEHGHLNFYHSAASVKGIYEEDVTFFCPSQKTERVSSGNITEEKTLDIFSFKIPITFNDNPYNEYNVKTESTPLTLFGKKLPISLDRRLYMEYSSVETVLDKDDMKRELDKQMQLYEENFLSDCRIIKRKCSTTEKETAMVMTVSYVLEGEIGTEKDLFLRDNRKPYVAGSKKTD